MQDLTPVTDVLIRAGRHVEPGTSSVTPAEVVEFNRRTIIMADSYVFASAVTDDLRHQIRGLKDERAGFVFDNLLHGDGSYHISRFIPVQ